MRLKTNGKYPRYAVWENVKGAFSSNNGDDFKTVLEEFCKIKNETIDVPKPDKWENAGCIMGEDFSIAWRLFDAQYWGVPQRRKRIYLVADFTGGSAGKILFESEGVSRYSPESLKSWQGTSADFKESVGDTIELSLNDQGGQRMDITEGCIATLRASSGTPPLVFENHSQDARYTGPLESAPSLLSSYGTGGNNQSFVLEHPEYTVSVQGSMIGREEKNGPRGSGISEDVSFTLNTADRHAIAFLQNDNNSSTPKHIVRKITPIECARLQGFPDWWCDNLGTENPTDEEIAWWSDVFETHRQIVGKQKKPKSRNQIIKWLKNPYSDSVAYKMWGNGVALPNVCFVLAGIAYYAQN